MKYVLKNAEFTAALTMLAGMVQLETNDEILDVILNIDIFGRKNLRFSFCFHSCRCI